MSFTVKVFQILDALDADAMESICHEDFIFVDDYEMQGRDDWIASLRKLWSEAPVDFSRDRNVLLDQRDIFSMQFTRDIDVARTELQMYRCLRTVSFGEVKYTGFLFNKID